MKSQSVVSTLKILLFGDASSVHIMTWQKEFQIRGHEVVIACIGNADKTSDKRAIYYLGEPKIDGLKEVVTNPLTAIRGWQYLTRHKFSRHFMYAKIGRRLYNVIENLEPDILNSHYASVWGVYAHYAGFHPTVTTVWGSDIYLDSMDEKVRPFLIKALSNSDLVHVETDRQDKFVRDLGAKKVLVQNWGVDLDYFNPTKFDGELREKLGGGAFILSTRELVNEKYGVNVILKAFRIVMQNYPQAKLLLCNDGPDRHMLEKLAEDLGISENVLFLGKIPQHMLSRYYASCDIYVQAPFTDGVSYSLLESMASSLPVISSKVGDTEANVKEEYNGFLFPAGDHTKLASLILLILEDEGIKRRLGANARKWVEDHCDRQKAFDSIEKLYHTLIR